MPAPLFKLLGKVKKETSDAPVDLMGEWMELTGRGIALSFDTTVDNARDFYARAKRAFERYEKSPRRDAIELRWIVEPIVLKFVYNVTVDKAWADKKNIEPGTYNVSMLAFNNIPSGVKIIGRMRPVDV